MAGTRVGRAVGAGMASPGAEARPQLARWAAFAAAMLVAAAILVHFHDRFWWGPDEGVYAHVAERILQGEVLNGSVQDIHLGYVNFANALALQLFGRDLVSLRYPLVALSFIQCALVFWLLAGRGTLAAVSGSVGMASLGFVQYLNPSAHWYTLFLCTAIIALLSTRWSRRTEGLVLLGFLLVTLVLFRQLTGIFAAMGVMTFLLLRGERLAQDGQRALLRLLAFVMLAGLTAYLGAKADSVGAALFAGGPLLLLLYAGMRPHVGNRALCRQVLAMALGGVPAALPLVLYHLYHGTVASWLDDTVVAALSLTRMDFMEGPRYYGFVLRGLLQVIAADGAAAVLNGVFWFVLPLLPLILALLLLRALRGGVDRADLALPVVAAFYAPASLHYQIPLYLFFSTPLTLAAILYLAAGRGRLEAVAAGAAVALSAIGLYYQAAQPISRGWDGIFAGLRSETMAPAALPHASLVLPAEEAALYREVLAFISQHSLPGDSILALPTNPELYFLAERRNPLRDPNVAIGLHSDARLAEVQKILRHDPPRVVLYQPDDKYVTPRIERLMEDLRGRYRLAARLGDFEIYLPDAD